MKAESLAPNQLIIKSENTVVFQSYDSIIVKIEKDKVFLDSKFWKYSQTTSKWRSKFLGENTKTTENKINSGLYILTDLNS
jgi:hypothetical protein